MNQRVRQHLSKEDEDADNDEEEDAKNDGEGEPGITQLQHIFQVVRGQIYLSASYCYEREISVTPFLLLFFNKKKKKV